MKKILFLSLFISFKIFGQTLELTPNYIFKNEGSDIFLRKSSGNAPRIIANRSAGTQSLPTSTTNGMDLFTIGVGGYTNTFTGERGQINFKATQNWTFGSNGTKMTFSTTANGNNSYSERMVIDHDGRVGIGTPTPTANLDVVRGSAPDGTALFRGTTHASHFNYSSTEDTYIRGGINGSNVIINDVAGLGNVGIGTTTPTKASLVVDKKIGAVHAIFGENTSGVALESSFPGISFNGYYNGGRKPLSNGFVGGMAMNPSTGLISIYNTFASGTAGNNVTTQDVITMDNFGKVGIGNSSPQATLHVSGYMRVDNLAGNGKVQLYADDQGTVSGVLPIAFSAEGLSFPSISNNTETTVPFEQEIFDEAGFFNNSTYEFSAPTKGIYHFDSSVMFGNVTSTIPSATRRMKILVDGNQSAITIQPMVVSIFQSLNLSKDIKLNVGQKVKITVQQDSGNNIVLTGTYGACSFFWSSGNSIIK